jgi:hypothetical protein
MFETIIYQGYIPILIILLGVLILFFGKIVGDIKIEKHDKLSYYIEGLFFSLWYIFLPFLLTYYILYIYPFRISVSTLILIGAQIIIYFLLGIFIKFLYTALKYGLLNLVKNVTKVLVENRLKQDVNAKKALGLALGLFSERWVKLFGDEIVLFIFSVITILSSSLLYKSGDALTPVSFVLTFFILIMVALAYGYNNTNYPLVKIYLVNGAIIEGRILKLGEYVCVLQDNIKRIFINKDKINYVEES